MTLVNGKQKSKPFLRWAGGKNWFLKHISPYIPEGGFNTYYEPFLGGGSVFFHLNPENAVLSDLNEELIFTYNIIKKDVEGVIQELEKFKNTEEFYYDIRNRNLKKDTRIAAKFIYLNQTSFNGIYRVNLKGEYNVPYGHRTKKFLDYDTLRSASNALKNTSIKCGDFHHITDHIKEKDLIFLDPPYTVTHNNNGFVKYNQKLFSLDDQYRLSELIDKIKSIGAYYILTNAAHDKIKEIFNKDDHELETIRASLIAGLKSKRGKYSELVFTNILRKDT